MRIKRSPRRAAAALVANTADIVEHILDHPFASKDLASLLRVSPLFFHIAGRKLYSTLPISNALNPFSSSRLGGDRWGGRGPYGKGQFFPYVRTVVVERAPVPERPIWAGWEELPPVASVEDVILQPVDVWSLWRKSLLGEGGDTALSDSPDSALIERLCYSATRIHIATPCYTNSGDCLQPIPLLPNVHTLVLRVHAAELAAFDDVAIVDALDNLLSRCSNIREMHLLLWGDIVYPSGVFYSIGWPRKGRICHEQLMDLVDGSYKLMEDFYHNLCSAAGELALRGLEVLQLYNVAAVLEKLINMDRLFNMDGSTRWLTGETTESLLTGVEKEFCWERDDLNVDETSEEETSEEEVSFYPAVAFYDTFGSYRDDAEEAWWSSVIEPSAKLSALRQQLADRTKQLADHFMCLNEKEIENILKTYEG
ncbi:hypothetical protein L198_00036 [Cryptococcus wingfieldii CBS 7118]|uniref:Uncharacterized protein n=1 Tax=Cryptococcus wingfieldii CBS 7118 TaxID=1295528 RepID=A0A1E3K620_9TREE|nr:hypothetical protein L198_00036 [Cryptococcus wingfieldii CBS 7118]ODO08313.1 hypothetical protein L198_00036 [Cryptococcus wingfieldii CBS 7118]